MTTSPMRVQILGLLTAVVTLAAFITMISFARAHFFALRIPTQMTVIDALPRTTSGIAATIDEVAVNGVDARIVRDHPLDVQADSKVTFRGWAFDSTTGKPASGAAISVDNAAVYPIAYGVDRPDVAKAYANEHLRAVGWAGQLPRATLSSGRHHISLIFVTSNGEAAFSMPLMTVEIATAHR